MRPRSAASATRPGSSKNLSRRRVEALSTQNKGFTAASAAKIAAEMAPKEDNPANLFGGAYLHSDRFPVSIIPDF